MVLAFGWAPGAPAQTNARAEAPRLAEAEKALCIQNLKTIYKAIQAYQLDHKDLPNWLSDLVPKYLKDANVLICPTCRRSGKTEDKRLADPKLPCSYLFEFCPVPLGNEAPSAAKRTRREWKRRQMGLVGSAVPIVRCRQHDKVLNLAFDGRIYESPGSWEVLFANRVKSGDLSAAKLFADDGPGGAGSRFPARDPKAGSGLLDLTRYYNASLHERWLGKTNADFSAMRLGLEELNGVEFDARGAIQLAGKSPAGKKYPRQVKGIMVRRKCKRLHFLHAACLAGAADDGRQVGSYIIHYANNQARLEIPIRCGREVADCRILDEKAPLPKELSVAWSSADTPKSKGPRVRLFETTWTNLAPNAEVESIDFVSAMAGPAPFLVAITVE